MHRDEKRLNHVLLIYRRMIPSIRLCGHCQLEELTRQGKLEYRAVQEMRINRADLNWADAVLLARSDNWYEYQLAKRLHEAGKYLIYVIDDDLLNIPQEVSSAAYYGKKNIQGYIRGMIDMSDAVLSPSPLLLEKYARDGRRALQIEEPAINPVPYKPHDPEKPARIGFAGSIDRTNDINEILKDALLRIKREYGSRVQFEFFGATPSFSKEIDARCIPYCDSYDQYRETLNSLEWDIGLAPMPDTPFHACKHYNKFVEYAAAGIVGIYSAYEPYLRLRRQCRLGLFCNNASDAWYMSIKRLLDNPSEREHLRQTVSDYVNEEMSIPVSAERLAIQLPWTIGEEKPVDMADLRILSIKAGGMWCRGCELIERYRWGILPRIVQVAWQRFERTM